MTITWTGATLAGEKYTDEDAMQLKKDLQNYSEDDLKDKLKHLIEKLAREKGN